MNRNKHQQVGEVVFRYLGIAEGVHRWTSLSSRCTVREDALQAMKPVELDAPVKVSVGVLINYTKDGPETVWMEWLKRKIAIEVGKQVCTSPDKHRFDDTDFFLIGDEYSKGKSFEGTLTLKEM